MSQDKIAKAIREKCPEGKLPCAVAFAIAKELGVSPMDVGRKANELGVKIIECQLGCFGWRKK